MKVLKVLGSIIISLVLFVFLLVLPLSYIVEDLVQDKIVGLAVKEAIKESVDKKKDSEISDEQIEVIEDLFEDKRIGEFLRLILEKYSNYKSDGKDSEITDKEYDKFLEFIDDYKDDIEELSGEKVDTNYIKENLSKEEINKELNNIFKDLDKEIEDDTAVEVIKGFSEFVSTSFRIKLIITILILIGLLMLINWSFIKWMIPTGVTSIIASLNIILLYGILKLAQGKVDGTDSSVDMFKEMSFNNVLYIGLGLLFIGIVLIVLYNIFKKKKVNETNPA